MVTVYALGLPAPAGGAAPAGQRRRHRGGVLRFQLSDSIRRRAAADRTDDASGDTANSRGSTPSTTQRLDRKRQRRQRRDPVGPTPESIFSGALFSLL